ncbi:UNVERIFIED_CONTAM: hypothetical protein C7454_102244 [Acidovorax defluvii]
MFKRLIGIAALALSFTAQAQPQPQPTVVDRGGPGCSDSFPGLLSGTLRG